MTILFGHWLFRIKMLAIHLSIYWQLYSTVTLRHGEKKHYNHKVDAYSFAIVLWELIHNKLPFEGMSNLQAAYAAAFKVSNVVYVVYPSQNDFLRVNSSQGGVP